MLFNPSVCSVRGFPSSPAFLFGYSHCRHPGYLLTQLTAGKILPGHQTSKGMSMQMIFWTRPTTRNSRHNFPFTDGSKLWLHHKKWERIVEAAARPAAARPVSGGTTRSELLHADGRILHKEPNQVNTFFSTQYLLHQCQFIVSPKDPENISFCLFFSKDLS